MKEKTRRKPKPFMPLWGYVLISAVLLGLGAGWLKIKYRNDSGTAPQPEPVAASAEETPIPVEEHARRDTYRGLVSEMAAHASALIAQYEGAVSNEHVRRFGTPKEKELVHSSDERNCDAHELTRPMVKKTASRIRAMHDPGTPLTEEHRLVMELQIALEDLMVMAEPDEDVDGSKLLYPVCENEMMKVRVGHFVSIIKRLDLLLPKADE